CDKKPLRKEFIERIVAEDAMAFLTPEKIELLADMAIKQNQEDLENDEVIPALRAEIHDLDKSISNLLKLVEKGAESETLAARLTDLEKQKRDCERRLVLAEDDYIILEREHIIWWLSKFLDGDIEDEEFRRQLIDLLVNSVTVWDEPDGGYKITAVYNLVEQNTQTFRVNADGSSDLRSQLPPTKKDGTCRLFSLVVFVSAGHNIVFREAKTSFDRAKPCQHRSVARPTKIKLCFA
ncbi:MAG: hypothetical protein IJQ80_06465, partial [Clostridia bacterium]|nr:hypothetical protein [Clostridia bacterium]